MLCIITLVLIAGGVILGASLSNDTKQPASADTTDIYIKTDGTTATSSDYDYSLGVSYVSGSGVCRLNNIYYYSTSVPTTLVIPDSVTISGASYEITTMNNSISSSGGVFYSVRSHITEVTLPSGLTYIGTYAFGDCSNLTLVTIPDSVTSIGNSTFYNCTSLTSVTIPDSVTSIGSQAFFLCIGLTSVTIPSSVISIGRFAFYVCYDLTSVYFYNDMSTSNIDSSAFTNGDSNVTYYFKDQASLDYVTNNLSSGYFTNTNFQLMQWNVTVNCNEKAGSLNYTEPSEITKGTEITATVTPNENVEFLYWEVKVNQNGTQIVNEQIESTTLNYTITDCGEYTFTAVFDIGVTITSLNGGIEFSITREANDMIIHSYVIQMNSGYYINGIYATNTTTQPTTDDFTNIKSIDGYLPNDYSTAIHYITNTTGTQLIFEIYNIGEPFTIYLDFITTAQNFKAGGSIEGIAVSVQYQGSDTDINLAVVGSAKILGYTTTNGLETVNVVAQEYTGYTFLGWQVDGEYVTYQDEGGQTITLQGYDYISASIPLSVIDGKQVVAVFTSTANSNNGQTDSGNHDFN